MHESILFVDDEKQILDALRRTFYGLGYNIFFAESGEEALNILANNDINLLISDIRMPNMNGYQLLEQVKAKYPSIIKVVLSGYADEHLLLKMQNMTLAKRYLNKPWKNQELIRIVGQIFRVEKLLKDKNLMELINKIEFLPSPGNVLHSFNKLVDQDADLERISKAIEIDQSVTAKILQVANSAIYGISTGSVKKAVSYLGLVNVKYIILSATSFRNEGSKGNSIINRDINNLWKHAISTNQILNYLYNRLIGKKIPEVYSMVGLLHDIGKIVLINNFTDRYLKAAVAIKNKEDMFYYYEQMEFTDTTHEEIGAYLLNWWELPQPIVEAVLYHHKPMDENVIDKELLALLYIADIYSWNYICGCEFQGINDGVLELFNISREECDQIVSEIEIDICI